ncbi:MAG: hypothetical protein LC109_13910 [Bacteroidia bacterium]|nr:hypothetical protein [Bacteroidia bacterium]
MSETSRYLFLPYLRKGLTPYLSVADGLGTPPSSGEFSRATVNAVLEVTGAGQQANTPVPQTLSLYGPADITGINPAAIVRVEPHDGSTDFLANYLSFAEFYEEDFPWSYTPFAAAGSGQDKKLRPWLALVVLEAHEYSELPSATGKTRGAITINNPAASLPPHDQLWAWAHVQLNTSESIEQGAVTTGKLDAIQTVLTDNPDRGVSRIICPRKLKPDTAYTAFLIPTFEAGRLAGLGEDFAETHPQQHAWGAGTSALDFPYYHTWAFRTSDGQDFTTLVQKIQAGEANPSLGKRPADISRTNYPLIDQLFIPSEEEEEDPLTQQYLLMEGALEQSGSTAGDWDTDEAVAYQEVLAEFLNLPATLLEAENEGDPVIAPPIYGKWHAAVNKVLPLGSSPRWIDQLNLDPRNRVAAAAGAEVVRRHQEYFMDLAWKLASNLDTANAVIEATRFDFAVSSAAQDKHIASLSHQEVIFTWAGSSSRILTSGTTLSWHIENETPLNVSLVSSDFRSLVRAGGDLAVVSGWQTDSPHTFLADVNTAVVTLDTVRVQPAHSLVIENYLLATELTSSAQSGQQPLENFVLTNAGTSFPFTMWTTGSFDSQHAYEARTLLTDNFAGVEDTVYWVAPTPPQANLAGIRATIDTATFAETNYTNRLNYAVADAPNSPKTTILQRKSIMAYPAIDIPAYEYLQELSADFIVPNFHKVDENSVTLLQLNNRFINSFFVGMNHEMSREMLWRKYPTDMRGSYFRKFWENTIPKGETDPVELNKYRDISPIHGWGLNEDLDDNRKPGMSPTSKPLVMVIRGELIEQFPNVNVYAEKAQWNVELNSEEELVVVEDEPRNGTGIKQNPIFYGFLQPDVMLVGFDLTDAEVKGDWETGTPDPVEDDPGWFFVLEERAGDTRFGAGMPGENDDWEIDPELWQDLNWGYIAHKSDVSDLNSINHINLEIISETLQGIPWSANSANMGVIFCRNSTKVLVHASNMLTSTN